MSNLIGAQKGVTMMGLAANLQICLLADAEFLNLVGLDPSLASWLVELCHMSLLSK
jgi:hypothetical protein